MKPYAEAPYLAFFKLMHAPDRWFQGISWVEKGVNIDCPANESADHIFNGDHHDDNGHRSVRFAARRRPSIQTHRRERVRAFGSAKRSSRPKAKVPPARLHRSSLGDPTTPEEAQLYAELNRLDGLRAKVKGAEKRRLAETFREVNAKAEKLFKGRRFGERQTAS